MARLNAALVAFAMCGTLSAGQHDSSAPVLKPPPGAVQLCAGHVTGAPAGPHIQWTAYYSRDAQEKVVAHYLKVLGSQNHSKETSEDVWRFPADDPRTVLSVSPTPGTMPLSDCKALPAKALTVIMISTMSRP